MNFQKLLQFYRSQLQTDVLAWWLRHAIDHEHGGVLSCIRDDGHVYSHDKYIWSQVRALWVFSAAYHRIERDPVYLKVADQVFDFCRDHGRTDEGDWAFRVSRDGSEIMDGADSIQTDAYAICAMVEYARASGRDEPMAVAWETYRRSREKLSRPGSYATRPYAIPEGTKAQRVSMQFSLAFHELAKATGDAEVAAEAMLLTDDVLDHFYKPEMGVTLEYLTLDNAPAPAPWGTYVSPGHGIETAWFQLENLRSPVDGRIAEVHQSRVQRCAQILRSSLNTGWDPQYGGLFYAMGLDGIPSPLDHAEAKIWWPHCEALCGTLMAYETSHQHEFLDWHDKVKDWSFTHFRDQENGEWTRRLDRDGITKLDIVATLPVKDPFHLPRALMYSIEACSRMADSSTETQGKL